MAQKIFKPATVVYSNGDSATGLVKQLLWQMTPAKIRFKNDEKSDVQVLRASQIKSLTIGDDTYISAIVDLDYRYDDLQRITIDEVIRTHVDTLLLKQEVAGPKPLYSYKDWVYHFYIPVDGKYELLRFKRYKSIRSNEVPYNGRGYLVRFQDKYLWQLQEYLPDCAASKPVITSTGYTLEGMLATFKAYYDCMSWAMK